MSPKMKLNRFLRKYKHHVVVFIFVAIVLSHQQSGVNIEGEDDIDSDKKFVVASKIPVVKNNESLQNQAGSRTKPLLVIQAGPPKTGSTFTQNTFSRNNARKILAKDNYVFIGGCDKNIVQQENYDIDECIQLYLDPLFYGPNHGRPTHKFNNILQQLKSQNKNGLLVLEYAKTFFDGLSSLTDEFDIHIVLTYRRLYEWLPSAWSEQMKHYDFSIDDGIGPVPFDFNEEKFNDKYIRNYVHPTQQVINEAEAKIGKDKYAITVMDMHAKHDSVLPTTNHDNDLLVELLCTGALPNASNTCDAARKDELIHKDQTKAYSNTRLEVHFQTLAYKAHKLGLLQIAPNEDIVLSLRKCLLKQDHKQQISQTEEEGGAGAKNNNSSYSSLPKVCMNPNHLEKMYQLSWEQEKKFYPFRTEDDHRKKFEEYRDRGMYCSTDVDTWLQLEEWQQKISYCEGEIMMDRKPSSGGGAMS